MTKATQAFPLRVVLSATTGRLLTKSKGPHDNGIGDLYKLLSYMTGAELFTHQLPRACDACRPWLLACFPKLESVDEKLEYALHGLTDPAETETAIEDFLNRLVEEEGLAPHYWILPLPAGAYEHKNPLNELVEMVDKKP